MADVVVFGTGFIGSAAARALAAAGRTVTMVGRRPAPTPAGVGTLVIDFTSAGAVADVVQGGCDVVFAAGPAVPAAVEVDPGPSREALDLLATVLAILIKTPSSTLQFVSSGGAVYGEPERVPIDESHPLRARSAYGVSKVAAEAMVASAVRRYGLNATSLRCGNAYGPGQDATRPQGLVAKLLDCATSGRPIEIWGDGGVERDFIHVDDIATVITVLAGRPRLPFAINVGSGQATSVRDVIEIVTHVTGQHIHVAHRAGRAFDVARVVLDTTLLRSITPFRPMPVETGIRATWASARASSAA